MTTTILIILLILLILLSAFFSSSETGMMSLNRYKLRHQARHNNKAAKRSQDLLKRPDRLLGVILLGNTFANIFASALATILATAVWGEIGALIATVVLTLVILLFSEILPKTFAVLYPEKIAYPASRPLQFLLKILYPIIWFLNTIANYLLKLCGIKIGSKSAEALTKEELRTVVTEASQKITQRHKHMLLGVLDLEQATVADVLIPKQRIHGIDINASWDDVMDTIINSPYSKMPVYRDNLDNIIGILQLRQALKLIREPAASIHTLERMVHRAYFIPETTTLQQQLIHFQKNGEHFALVVDEYGDIQGMVTLEDIIEEIVGAFVSDQPANKQTILPQTDGSYIVPGSMTIRDLNRALGLEIPTSGAKTLSGLITDYLQAIPTAKTGTLIHGYPIEIMQVEDNAVKKARIKPRL